MTGCAETVYNFEIGTKVYPDTDSIHMKDAIWFEIDTPDTLRDLRTNDLINYNGVENLGSVIGFQKLGNGSFTIKAANKFKKFVIAGKEDANSSDPELFVEYVFDDTNGYYQFKLGVMPLDTGIFRIVFSNAANVYRKSDKCTKASFTINFQKTDQHYYLSPDFQGGSIPAGGDYYFKVVP